MRIVELLCSPSSGFPVRYSWTSFDVRGVATMCAHLVSQNDAHAVGWSSTQQIQSDVVTHGLPDPSALMPVVDRQGASSQGIPGIFNGRTRLNTHAHTHTRESLGGWGFEEKREDEMAWQGAETIVLPRPALCPGKQAWSRPKKNPKLLALLAAPRRRLAPSCRSWAQQEGFLF